MSRQFGLKNEQNQIREVLSVSLKNQRREYKIRWSSGPDGYEFDGNALRSRDHQMLINAFDRDHGLPEPDYNPLGFSYKITDHLQDHPQPFQQLQAAHWYHVTDWRDWMAFALTVVGFFYGLDMRPAVAWIIGLSIFFGVVKCTCNS